ncbi:hypothetical protein I302_108211 [Kwoniella bestiolae CBS 10118]|uniref:Asp/Glu/hydantoin racemase n=1 Tax=Kwoniella bestiolae CBS 10118 TaxID=1296100 RepID=A0A1B9FWD3_9TREE|nr:hypothetical protein I302_07424 [Kwoniella bestiolae CBS 10118]OCF23073.1 hypothetical protein I302_07424 [Kwoniella bestiolae CBS 10118]
MPFLLSPIEAGPSLPRILVINPNATITFTEGMQRSLSPSPDIALDFYNPSYPAAPYSIEGVYDSVTSAAGCLEELKPQLGRWSGFVVACFSNHPLTEALRELTSSPVTSILSAPLLLASNLGSRVGILTTSPRWVPLLTHDIHALHLSPLCAAGVVSSGLSVLDLEHLPRERVMQTLTKMAKDELEVSRQADVIVLGCGGMVGLDREIKAVCREGMVVIDPVVAGVEVCGSLVRMRLQTGKLGIYAQS